MTRRRPLLAAFAVVAVAAVAVSISGRPPAADSRPAQEFRDSIPPAGELRSMALRYEDRIKSLEGEIGSLRDALEAVQEGLAALATREEPRPIEAVAPAPPDRIAVLDVPRPPSRGIRIPAGSFAEATLLTGVYAPVTGDAMPVLLRLDAVMQGPNGRRLPLRGAFVVGKAVGDANASRAVVQLVRLSTDAGDVLVNGYVVDDDGIQGLAGTYVWNAGQLAALAAASGAATGAARAIGQAETASVLHSAGLARELTGDPGRFVGSAAGAAALDKVSEIVSKRMEEFVPAIYVHNRDRRVTAVLLEEVTLPEEGK